MAPSLTWNTKRVFITYRNLLTGSKEAGTWDAVASGRIVNTLDDGTKQVFRPGKVGSGTLNTTEGSPSLDFQLPIVDDPDNSPQGGEIVLTITFGAGGSEVFHLSPLHTWPDLGTDLALILDPAVVASAPPLNVKGVPGGVAALDADGDVVNAAGIKITSGTKLTTYSQVSALTGYPTTFPPVVGTTSTTAKAGNYAPAWTEVAGRPTLAAVATTGSYNDLTSKPLAKPWLVVDGIHILEGANGPAYRTTGYNCYVMKSAGGTVAQTMNATQRDNFFAGLRPNSLTRVWAFAPVGGTFTWAFVLAELDAIVASAKKYGQRIIFTLTGMGAAANDAFGGKNAAWFNAHTWRTSVSGATSLQAWTETVVARYASEPTVSVYDLINEPLDTGAAFTADLVLYAQEMAGYVRAANPNALVYAGAMYPSAVGGVTAYQQFFAGLDFCSYHNYDTTGYVSASSQAITVPVGMGKPILIDEYGVWAKSFYGTSSDTDKDTNGLPAVNYKAQELLVRSFLETSLAVPNIFGALIWSYMDSDASWYDGLGRYEPVNQSGTRRVLATFPLNEPGALTSTQFSTLTTWIDARFTLRYPPTTQIGGPNSGTTIPNLIYDRMSANYRQGTQTAAPSAAQDTTLAVPSLQFSGTNWFATTASTGPGAHSLFAVISPTALPGAGAFAYLVAPSSATAGFAVRLTSAGLVQLVNYNLGTPTIIGTGTTVLATTGKMYLLEVRWDAVGGGWRIRVNGNADANGTATTTLGTDIMIVGAAPGATSGYVGHIIELMKFSSSVGTADQNRLYAYFARRYGF